MEEKDNIETTTYRMLYEHFLKNIPFYIVLSYCLYLISGKSFCSINYIRCIFSWIFIGMLGYFTHVISHNVDLRTIYNMFDNVFTRNAYYNKAMDNILKVYEFHDESHHNLEINKEPLNIFYEFVTNIYTQGLWFILLVEFVKLIDTKVVLLWCFMYATIHNINYNIVHPYVHRDHHKDCHTNYGIDVMDILFNTKYDKNDIENFNHVSINLLILTFIIVLL
jgi:hypothetical protein